MHTTLYKINDQDPLYNTTTLSPHPLIAYMGKKKKIYIYVLMEVKQVVVEGKKKYPQYCNSPVYSISNDDIKTEETKKKC